MNLQVFIRKIDIADGLYIVRPHMFMQIVMKTGFGECRLHLYNISCPCKIAVDVYGLGSYL